uniref:COBRA C-terminal domain-containing protein n=1 Tax=Solanum lycopersicum TaxID=4081 RepID=A0A3Q7FS12_SOLLC
MKMFSKSMIFYILLFSVNIKAQDYDGKLPPAENNCNGIFLSYVFISRTKELPHVKNATAQAWAFKATATVLNAGIYELKNWKIFIGFQNRELLVSASNAVLLSGDDLPAPVGNGTYLAGYPQTDLKTSIDTAGDVKKIQAEIELTGTQFGIKPPGYPMPKTIKLFNDGYKCPAVKRKATKMHVCCLKDPKFKVKNFTTKFFPRQNGDLLISYDVMQAYTTNYQAQVTIQNSNPLGRLDQWNLTWEWMRGEFIYSMRGAYTRKKDYSNCVYGAAGQYYKDFDFSKVLNCEKKPTIADLPRERAQDKDVGMLPFCCRNGSIMPTVMDATNSKSVFQLQVYKLPPDLNLTALYPPERWKIVDDMLIAAKKKYDIQKLKGLLSAEFEMKDLGAARKILGMEIIRDRERRKLFLSQRSYIQKVLARFGMSSSKPIDTPSDTQCLVTGYSDSDYAGDVDTRRSMTGYVFTLGGSVVSWKATLQPTVTLSTTEAEYMALTEAAKEGICSPLNLTALYPPERWKIVAIASWQIVCNITKPKDKANRCCVSYSAYYNDSAIPCNTCACGCDNSAKCSQHAPGLLLPPEALLVPFANRREKSLYWAKLKHYRVPKQLPCGDNCGVTINWHIDSNYKSGWTARITLFNWGAVNFVDWFVGIQFKKTGSGFAQAFSFNGTLLRNINDTIFLKGLPGLNYLMAEVDGRKPGDPRVPGKQQSVLRFNKKHLKGIDILKGDGFPTKLLFNGEECALPTHLLAADGRKWHAKSWVIAMITLLTFLLMLKDLQ